MGAKTYVFEDCVFIFIPSAFLTSKFIGELAEIVIKNGGSVSDPLENNDLRTYEATHIISTTIDFPQYVDALAFMVPVVTHNWIQHALTRKKLPQPRPYSPDPRLIFSNVNVTVKNLSAHDSDGIAGAVIALGGCESESITRLTTHICCMEVTDELAAEAKARGFRGVFVVPHWFNDCFRLGKKINDQPYILPNAEYFTKTARDGILVPTSSILQGAYDPNPGSLPLLESQESRLPLQVFANKAVMLGSDLTLTDGLRTAIIEIITESGGRMAETPDDCDMYIGRYRVGEDYVRASQLCKDVGNLSWLYHLIVHDRWTSPLKRLLHYPIPKEPLPGFAGLKVTVSNYGGEARTYLENLITAAGAEFTKTMRTENTHLVTARKSGEKSDAAADWNIEIVNHLWVEESYAKCALQPCSNRRFNHFPARTNLTEVIGQTFLDENLLRELYYPGGGGGGGGDNLPKSAQLKRRIRDIAKDNVHKKGIAKGTFKYTEDENDVTGATPAKTASTKKQKLNHGIGADVVNEYTTPIRSGRARSTISAVSTAVSISSDTTLSVDMSEADMSVPASRSAKFKAAKHIQRLVQDMKLYEQEKKRTKDGIWGGKRAADELEKQMQESAKKKPVNVKEESPDDAGDEGKEHPAKKRRGLPDIKYRIMITGYRRWAGTHPKNMERDIQRLREFGIKLVDDGNPCQYLAAPSILRTLKFLKMLAKGPTIINSSFLDDVLDQGTALDPADYILKDAVFEKANNYSLAESLARARVNKGKTLGGVPIFCTDFVANGKETYRVIANANGATWRDWTGRNVIKAMKGESQMPTDQLEPVYLLSSDSDKEQRLYGRFVEMAVNGRMEPRIVITNWLLEVAMRQEYFWDDKYLVANWFED